jgi:hypothetical protein
VSIIRTRLEFRTLVSRRARIVDHLNAHPSASLNIDGDDAYRELRTLATNSRWSTFLKTTGALSLPTTAAVAGENYAAIPVPIDCTQVRKLEVKFGSVWQPIEEVGLTQLRMFSTASAQQRGPFAWALLDQGVQATTVGNDATQDPGVIALSPIPSSGSYQLWYLPEFSNLTADSGAGGFYTYANDDQLQYHVYATVAKVLISDNDSQGMLAGALQMLQKFEARIMAGAPSKSGPRTWRRSRNYHS